MNPQLQRDVVNRSKVLDDNADLLNGMIATVNTNLSEHKQLLDELKTKYRDFEPVKSVVSGIETDIDF